VSMETHYSVARALALMGLGEEGATPVPVDERFRMRPEALERAKREAEARGRKVVAVVASAGSTSTGAFDPLAAVADVCVWKAHRMMLMPPLVTAVLFRAGARSYQAFAQDASYLFDGRSPEDEW